MDETTNTVETQNTEGQEQSTKTYSQEEVDKLLQQETDRRVTSALKKQEAKTAEKIKESEKLARMNEQEKFQYELDQREKAIAAKEKELSLAENKNEASKILSEKGISLRLVDFVVDAEADVMNERIKLLDTEFKKSVKAEVEKRLSSTSPKRALNADEGVTVEQFKKMTIAQQNQLYHESPEVYKSIVNQIKK